MNAPVGAYPPGFRAATGYASRARRRGSGTLLSHGCRGVRPPSVLLGVKSGLVCGTLPGRGTGYRAPVLLCFLSAGAIRCCPIMSPPRPGACRTPYHRSAERTTPVNADPAEVLSPFTYIRRLAIVAGRA